MPRNDETLFACGTNALNPTCRNYRVSLSPHIMKLWFHLLIYKCVDVFRWVHWSRWDRSCRVRPDVRLTLVSLMSDCLQVRHTHTLMSAEAVTENQKTQRIISCILSFRRSFLFSHSDRFPGEWCCDLQEFRRRGSTCPAYRQIRFQMAQRCHIKTYYKL